jgi:hypothetical protein
MRYLLGCTLSLVVAAMANAEPTRPYDDEGPLRYPYPARARRAVDDTAAARSLQNIQLSANYVDPCNYCWGGPYYYGSYPYLGYGPVWGYRPLGYFYCGRSYYWRR